MLTERESENREVARHRERGEAGEICNMIDKKRWIKTQKEEKMKGVGEKWRESSSDTWQR